MPGITTLASALPDGTSPYWLSQLGSVEALAYSDEVGGGPSGLSCTLRCDPKTRHAALRPGRRIQGFRGADVIWEGKLTEPVPGDDGWALTADGAGTWGSRFIALYPEGTAATNWNASYIVGQAISRGLEWAAGTLTGEYKAEPRDPGALSIGEFMDQVTFGAGKTWRVTNSKALTSPTGPATWTVDIKSWPSTPTRLLRARGPVARTLAGYVNQLYARYMVTADTGNVPATYGQRSATGVADSVHGRYEAMWDMVNAGVLSSGTVDADLAAALARYQAAYWAGPFTVNYGDYMTMGGVPVDLGCEKALEVAQLIFASGPYGGEPTIAPPIKFTVSRVDYDQDTDTLQVTPAQPFNSDLSSILSRLLPQGAV